MLVQRVLILLWKYLLVKEEELFYWWKVSKFLLAALFANARRVDVSKFRVENTAILRLRPRKLIFLLFSKIKGFLREQLTSDYLSTLKLFMDKQWRKSIFQLLPLDGRYFSTVALNISKVAHLKETPSPGISRSRNFTKATVQHKQGSLEQPHPSGI